MDIKYLKGVGDKRKALFAKLKIETAEELLRFYPRAYEDRSNAKAINELEPGENCCVKAVMGSEVIHSRIRQGMDIYKAHVFDETGTMYLTFFNAPYVKDTLKQGHEYIFYGKNGNNPLRAEMTNPIFEPIENSGKSTGRILPRYRLTAGLNQTVVRNAVASAFEKHADSLIDSIPSTLLENNSLCSLRSAVENIHFPQNYDSLNTARKRLVYEELLVLQLALLLLKNTRERRAGYSFQKPNLEDFYRLLPFTPTNGQIKAIDDCLSDFNSGRLCHRLIQGDVGSGKTVVAVACIIAAARAGMQSAFMAPTEILAQQHYNSVEPLLKKLGITAVLLTGSVTVKNKRQVNDQIASGIAQCVIGTHALISSGVEFKALGLTITDEQHRFGVRHQEALSLKSGVMQPHRVVMSATPIPRTLGLIMYGDMDVSVIREMPPGRVPVKTYVVTEDMRERINAFIQKTVTAKRQVYIVCPMIGDELELGYAAAEEYAEKLENMLPDISVGLIHGKMNAKKKDAVMRAFAGGEINVLVATTVIEVGINVPNATLMIVENAERFGLSQLHQLRGRVGRGSEESFCVLFLQSKGETARARLDVMRRISDGFSIAEADLQIRGPGDFFGERQHGLPELKIADLSSDMEIMQKASEDAQAILKADALLGGAENIKLKEEVLSFTRRMSITNGQQSE